jgi:hypothetical protein
MTWTLRECAMQDWRAALEADQPIRRTLGWNRDDYQAAIDGRDQLRAAAWRSLVRTVEAAKATPRTLHKEPDDATLDAMAARAAAELAGLADVAERAVPARRLHEMR